VTWSKNEEKRKALNTEARRHREEEEINRQVAKDAKKNEAE